MNKLGLFISVVRYTYIFFIISAILYFTSPYVSQLITAIIAPYQELVTPAVVTFIAVLVVMGLARKRLIQFSRRLSVGNPTLMVNLQVFAYLLEGATVCSLVIPMLIIIASVVIMVFWALVTPTPLGEFLNGLLWFLEEPWYLEVLFQVLLSMSLVSVAFFAFLKLGVAAVPKRESARDGFLELNHRVDSFFFPRSGPADGSVNRDENEQQEREMTAGFSRLMFLVERTLAEDSSLRLRDPGAWVTLFKMSLLSNDMSSGHIIKQMIGAISDSLTSESYVSDFLRALLVARGNDNPTVTQMSELVEPADLFRVYLSDIASNIPLLKETLDLRRTI